MCEHVCRHSLLSGRPLNCSFRLEGRANGRCFEDIDRETLSGTDDRDHHAATQYPHRGIPGYSGPDCRMARARSGDGRRCSGAPIPHRDIHSRCPFSHRDTLSTERGSRSVMNAILPVARPGCTRSSIPWRRSARVPVPGAKTRHDGSGGSRLFLSVGGIATGRLAPTPAAPGDPFTHEPAPFPSHRLRAHGAVAGAAVRYFAGPAPGAAAGPPARARPARGVGSGTGQAVAAFRLGPRLRARAAVPRMRSRSGAGDRPPGGAAAGHASCGTSARADALPRLPPRTR